MDDVGFASAWDASWTHVCGAISGIFNSEETPEQAQNMLEGFYFLFCLRMPHDTTREANLPAYVIK